MSDSLWPHGLQHSRLPCPSLSPRVGLNSCPLSQWCYLTISSSVSLSSSCPQYFPASGYFPMSQLFASGGQSIAALASAAVLPIYIKSWFPLGLPGLVSLLSMGLSRVFSSTTVQKHQFSFPYSPTLTSIRDYWKHHSFDYMDIWTTSVLIKILSMSTIWLCAFFPVLM